MAMTALAESTDAATSELPATTEQALGALDVTSDVLTAEQYEHLDTHGYLMLPDVVDPEWLGEIRDRLQERLEKEGAAAGHEVSRQFDVNMLANLLNKGEMFERMVRAPQVLAAAHHVLGDMKVNSLNYRLVQPGRGQQELHSDCDFRVREDGTYRICNSMWLVDDFTADNGATRVVPGTHRSGKLPIEVVEDPMANHPDEQIVTGKAGSVMIFNSHLWHGGSLNRSDGSRGGMTLSFTRRDERQQTNQAEHIRKQVWDRLSPAERFLWDV